MNENERDDSHGPDPGAPVPQLEALREEPSSRFLEHVLDGINTRQTTAQAFELTWWGFTDLFLEFVQAMFRALGVRGDAPEKTEP